MSTFVDKIARGDIAPWVGEGRDGAERSAQIVRDEIATLAADDPRRPELEAQAAAWDARARMKFS